MSVSPCCEGHVTVVNTSNLSVASVNRGAHMIFVTTMAFNTDGTAFLSVGFRC
jgi:prolactin regulatory element-binding protein